jgi:zinc transporter 7
MIAFATGGLLGDVFLHLVPHSFFGEGGAGCEEHRSIVVEEKRNIIIGSADK